MCLLSQDTAFRVLPCDHRTKATKTQKYIPLFLVVECLKPYGWQELKNAYIRLGVRAWVIPVLAGMIIVMFVFISMVVSIGININQSDGTI